VTRPSILACKVALSRDPGNAEIMEQLAAQLLDAGRATEAEPWLRTLVALNAGRHELQTALGNALKTGGRFLEAEQAYRQALALAPEDLPARYNLAILDLLQGRLQEGWEGRELRWQAAGVPQRGFAEPLWDGSPLGGRTLLLHGAQEGFGDAIMALRFAFEAKTRGARVLVECHPHLVALFATCPAVDALVAWPEPLPPFHCQAPLMSLPRILGTELATIPWPGPYLRAPGGGTSFTLPGTFKVGLVHAGNPTHPDDASRSIPPDLLEPLARLRPHCAFFSLQKHREPDLPPLPESLGAMDLGGDLPDFAATARLLTALDVLVTVDTAVAHLAGAMGRDVRLLLPFEPDWRWLLNRADSPWYPSLRLFRQPEPGDWATPVAELEASLHDA
jgi:hypothetical protein